MKISTIDCKNCGAPVPQPRPGKCACLYCATEYFAQKTELPAILRTPRTQLIAPRIQRQPAPKRKIINWIIFLVAATCGALLIAVWWRRFITNKEKI